jgi:hypothetical protein
MWPRLLEAALAAWLAASPFVFGATGAARVHDLAVAAVLAALALASFTRRLRMAHLFEVPLALGLIAYGWLRHEAEPTAVAQNHMLLGLTLLMTAILPTHATRPPPAWEAAIARHARRDRASA